MNRILNMTPHVVTLVDDAGEIIMRFAPEDRYVRCRTQTTKVAEINGIPITENKVTELMYLPPKKEGTYIIVSSYVADTVKRDDLLVPNGVITNEAGVKIGCTSLRRVC